MYILKINLKSFLINYKRFLIFICLIALLCVFAGLLGNYFLYSAKIMEPVSLAIVDNDDSIESRTFYNIVDDLKEYQPYITFNKTDEETAMRLLKENEIDAFFSIPKNFAENVMNGKNEPFLVTYNSASPVKAQMLEYFANSFTQMLTASQIGVYAALDYTKEFLEPDQYPMIFRGINLKYLSVVLNRAKMLEREDVSVIGGTNIFSYYFFSAYVFMMIAGCLLFIDIMQKNFNKDVLRGLRKRGVGSLKITLCNILSVFIAILFINVIFGFAAFAANGYFDLQIEMNLKFIGYIALILFCVSAFAVFISSFFKNILTAGIFISVFSVLCLFLSGGIIPVEYFPQALRNISVFIFNFWAVRLLTNGFAGIFELRDIMIVITFLAAALLLAVGFYYKNSRAGEEI